MPWTFFTATVSSWEAVSGVSFMRRPFPRAFFGFMTEALVRSPCAIAASTLILLPISRCSCSSSKSSSKISKACSVQSSVRSSVAKSSMSLSTVKSTVASYTSCSAAELQSFHRSATSKAHVHSAASNTSCSIALTVVPMASSSRSWKRWARSRSRSLASACASRAAPRAWFRRCSRAWEAWPSSRAWASEAASETHAAHSSEDHQPRRLSSS
mmetsp:Transcript_13463/g.31879  ORF Transcript_13463/g.31879 Transcript_13463/m.31879 type:complete len:213 (+) Transcript_13463:482-1120(+)